MKMCSEHLSITYSQLIIQICGQGMVWITINPFMDGSFSEWFACAESAPHLPSYLTAGAEQWDQTGPSLAARVVLSFGAAMLAVPLSPR